MADITEAARVGTEASRRQLMRAVIASTIGTSIEWYDLFLYGFAASTVFAKIYFPSKDPTRTGSFP